MHPIRDGQRYAPVVFAPLEKHRDVDLAQPAIQVGIARPRRCVDKRLTVSVPTQQVVIPVDKLFCDAGRIGVDRLHAATDQRAWRDPPQRLTNGPGAGESLDRRRFHAAQAPRIDEYQRVDAVGVFERQRQRDTAAERIPRDIDATDAEMVQEVGDDPGVP